MLSILVTHGLSKIYNCSVFPRLGIDERPNKRFHKIAFCICKLWVKTKKWRGDRFVDFQQIVDNWFRKVILAAEWLTNPTSLGTDAMLPITASLLVPLIEIPFHCRNKSFLIRANILGTDLLPWFAWHFPVKCGSTMTTVRNSRIWIGTNRYFWCLFGQKSALLWSK